MARILVVDDDASIVNLCQKVLQSAGYDVTPAYNGTGGLDALAHKTFDLVLLDVNMPDVNGIEVLQRVREMNPHLAVVIITGVATRDVALSALHSGAQDFLMKPFSIQDLKSTVHDVLEKQQMRREHFQLRSRLPILKLNEALLSGASLEDAYEIALNIVVDETRATRTILFIYENKTLTAAAGRGVPQSDLKNLKLVLSEDEVQELLSDKRTIPLDGAAWSVPIENLFPKLRAYHPLATSSELTGLLCVDQLELSRGEEELLSIMTGQLAGAIERAKLFRDAMRHINELSTLTEIGPFLSTVLDPAELLPAIYQQVARVMDVTNFYIALYDEDTKRIDFPICRVDGEPVKESSRLLGEGTKTDYVIRTSEPFLSSWDTHNLTPVKELLSTDKVPKSFLGVPVLIGNRVLGMMAVQDFERDDAYDDTLLGQFITVAAQAAVAIQNARLFEESQRRKMQLTTAAEISKAATSILDVSELLSNTVNLLRERFKLYYVAIFLVERAENVAVLRAATGEAGNRMLEQGYKEDITAVSFIGWCIINRQPRILLDVGEDAVVFEDELLPEKRSEMVMPLISRGQVIGAMSVQSDVVAAFSDEDVVIFQTVADQLANAVVNARLYESEQNRRRWSETLRDAGRVLSSTLELQEVLSHILDQLAVIIPYARAAVMLQSDSHQMHMMAARGFPDEERALQTEVPIHENDVFQQLKESERPLVVDDVTKTDWQQLDWLPLHRSWMGVPLIARDRVFGMISLTREEPNTFAEEETQVVSTFANQSAIALENARLYAEITQLNLHLEDKVRERTDELERAYRNLQQLDQAKSDFINIAAHELRTPLTMVLGYADMILQEETVRETPFVSSAATQISKGATRLNDIISNMLDVSKIDSGVLALHPNEIVISNMLRGVVDEFEKVLVERDLNLKMADLEDLPLITGDEKYLYKAFYHLVINAVKYTPDGGSISISGSLIPEEETEVEHGWVEIVVEDTGIGIDAEHQEVIFNKFYRTGDQALHSTGKTKFKGAGPGLGLFIAKGVIEAHNGQIWVESDECNEEMCPGSKFFVRLPAVKSEVKDDVDDSLAAMLRKALADA